MEKVWALKDAKSWLSQQVSRAQEGEPQVITRRGRKVAGVLSYDEWERMRGREVSVWEALSPPLLLEDEEVEILFRRMEADYREVNL